LLHESGCQLLESGNAKGCSPSLLPAHIFELFGPSNIYTRKDPPIGSTFGREFLLLLIREFGRNNIASQVIYKIGIPWSFGGVKGEKIFIRVAVPLLSHHA